MMGASLGRTCRHSMRCNLDILRCLFFACGLARVTNFILNTPDSQPYGLPYKTCVAGACRAVGPRAGTAGTGGVTASAELHTGAAITATGARCRRLMALARPAARLCTR